MLHAITYSIVTHLKTAVPALKDVVWLYDGISLTGRAKPFMTVEQMQSDQNVTTKGREYFERIYHFQLGLMAESITQRSQLSDVINNALLQPNIKLLDTSQFPATDAGSFYCDVLAITPMPVESVTDDTNKHRVYFDVEVYALFKQGEQQFKQ